MSAKAVAAKHKKTTHKWFLKSISIMILGIVLVASGIILGGLDVIMGSFIGLTVHIYGITQLRKANFQRHVDHRFDVKIKEGL
jgi:hypothetical protein